MRQLAIKVRARTGKETLTLGFIVARHYFFTLLCAALPGWMMSVALAALLWWWLDGHADAPLWAMFVVWWLKPLYERPVLVRLSRLMFHEKGDWRREQKSAFARGFLAELTVLRLLRGNAPIRHALHLLEGVRGREYRERKRFFNMADGGVSTVLLLALLEGGMLGAMLILLPDMSPGRSDLWLFFYGHGDGDYAAQAHALLALTALLYFPLAALATVFYVSIGFMRYLNRRIISEGWAIELDLRALAARLPAVCLAVLFAFFAGHAPQAQAIDAAQSAADKAWVEARVNDVQSGPYVWRSVPQDGSAGAPTDFSLSGAQNFARMTRLVLIVGGVGLLLWLLFNVLKYGRVFRGSVAREAAGGAQVSRHEAAPDTESCAAALRYCQAGQMVAALAVLYGRMVAAPERHHLPAFVRGESESEYLHRAAGQLTPRQNMFLRDFFALWQRTVYARQTPDKSAVHEVIRRYQDLWP